MTYKHNQPIDSSGLILGTIILLILSAILALLLFYHFVLIPSVDSMAKDRDTGSVWLEREQ